MKKSRRIFHFILIVLVATLIWTPAARAVYSLNYKISVDHTRVAGLDGTPPSGFGFLKGITIDHTQVAGSSVTPPTDFGYVKKITIDNTKVSGTSDLTDFPVLVSIKNDAVLKTTTNGGRVTDPQGDDIVFYAADLTTVLDYEVEQYDGTTGTLVAWVRLPVLSFALDTVFYLAYGNGSISSPQAIASNVWDSNFKGVWHMDEASGSIVDSTANSVNGTYSGDLPTPTGGRAGNGQNFDGTDDSVHLDSTIPISTNYTASLWYKTATIGEVDVLIVGEDDAPGSNDIYYYLGTETNGTIRYLQRVPSGSSGGTSLYSSASINDGSWHHVASTFDGTNMRLYIDGAEDANSPAAFGTAFTDSIDFYLGILPSSISRLPVGIMDEVRISGTARSADWIATEYNSQNNPAGFMTIEDSGGLVDFPVLVSISNDATIKTTANGGRVTDAQGDDLVFYAADLTTVLHYEVEQYDGATGTLVAWVRMPVLANDVDTVFYLAYGNSGITSPQAIASNVWDSNFKGVWHLNDATDATVVDSSGYSNDGSPMNSPAASSAGKSGGALDFGGGSAVSVGSLNIAGSHTLSGWVYPQNLGPTVETYFRIAGSTYLRHDGINSQGQVHFYIVTDGTNRHLRVNGQLSDNTWYHLAGTWDGTSQAVYINGQLADGQQPGGVLDDPTSAYTITAPTGSPADAIMDEVRYSDTARSAAWIATEYNNQSNPGGFMTIRDSGPLVDFPVLVSIQNDAQLKTTTNGGQVTDADGDDIIFTAGADGAGPLDHEVESYDPATGTLVAWVRIPALAVSEDTIFYLHYGNGDVSTSQQNAAAVWDSNFKGVWHLAESVTDEQTSGSHIDSTANNNDGSQNNNAPAAGQIAGAQDFDGAADYINLGTMGNFGSTLVDATYEFWINTTQPTVFTALGTLNDGGATAEMIQLNSNVFGSDSEGYMRTYTRDQSGSQMSGTAPIAGFNDGGWHQVTAVVKGPSGVWQIYFDGSAVTVTIPGTDGSPDNFANFQYDLTLGARNNRGAIDNFAAAAFDEVRISDMARPADWITTTYNNQRWPNKAQHPAEGFITVVRSVCQLATPVTCGSTTAGSIENPGAWDAFEVTVAADGWLNLFTTGTTDTFGHLYDGNCVEIAQNDTVDYNFNLSQTAAAGTYYVQVRHASETGTGDYELHVDCGDDDHGDSIDEATAVDCGSPAAGKINSAADEDYFKVVFWGTGILTAFTSGAIDTRGALLDDAGNPIGADDNSGSGDNFEIVRSVSPGVYYVVVSGPAAGDYTVQVNCEYTPVITATAEYGGTISPAGGVGVTYDGSQTFTITPDAGNTIRDVWVDGEWVGAVSSYEFQNVQKDHKIVAVFNADFENCVDIPDIPLDAWYRSAPANVMFVLDDSGSMDWEFMTAGGDGLFDDYYRYVFDDPGDNLYGRVLPDNRRLMWKSQWAVHNKLYYNSAVDYQPWPNHVAGDPAATLPAAHPDTPRSHPMETPIKTFDLNQTYVQYTNDAVASAITINDQDSGFSKIPVGGGPSGIIAGFEGPDWDDGFENNGTTSWNPDNNQQHGGAYSALAAKNAGGDLISNNLDTSDLSDLNPGDSITVDFWFKKQNLENNYQDFYISYFDGNNYDQIADLDSLGADGTWLHYQATISDSQYFKSNFHIRLKATMDKNDEKVWVDDVVIRKNGGFIDWEQATGSDEAQNGEYWWTAADLAYTATWTPDIPTAGDYDVYARWHADVHHSQSVPYTINYAGGASHTVPVNQRLDGGSWVHLGTYPFDAGSGGNVTISYTRNGDYDRVCADAVKFAPAGAIGAIDIKRAHYYVWSESEAKPYLVVLDGDIDYYVVTDANGNDKIDAGEIAAAPSPPADVQTSRDYTAERQNFANWYQFYRRRELAATAAVANVIAGLKGVQVGFYSINGNLVNPAVPVKSAGIDKSKNLLQALYGLKIRAQGTPLRRGLREVGKYFADSSSMIGSSPYATVENGGACQQAFAIVMTDGFWNGSSPYVGNADGDDNTAYDGGGRADIYEDTLADVAMKYYETDLHTGLDDNVPAHHQDPATHQHMVTYAVSFGRVGSLNPDDYDIANGSFPAWPDPRYVGAHKIDDLWHAAVNGRGEFLSASSPTELIDSLLAISRNIQSRIASSASVSVNGDPLYQELTEYTRMYQATYRSDSWVGDVSAYQIDEASGEVAATPDWTAADRLETVNWDTGRIIATFDGSIGIPFRYNRSVLSSSQQRALGSDLANNSDAEKNAVKILNYLRGERGNEAQYGGAFRDRFQVLGDIVHSSPVYHNGTLYAGGNDGMLHAFDSATGDERFAYVPNLVFGNLSALVDPKYSHKYFVDLSPTIQDVTLGGQAKTILVGGLGKGGKGYYALDVTNPADISNENELAARVLWEFPDPQSEGYLKYDSWIAPIPVGTKIHTLSGSSEGQIAAIPLADMAEGTGILNLTDVIGTFQDGDDLYFGPAGAEVKVARADGRLYDPYMGYSYSRPVIARSNDSSTEWLAIFGNGYNSQKSHAVLYILNAATGALIKRIDTGVGNCNGMSSPIAIDIDSNGTADYVYAGDLQGNLWKFDLHDTDAANWEVAYEDPGGNPAPVFQAKNYSGHPQPITSKPDVMYHCSRPGYLVTFGTGRYLTELDLVSSESSTIYGIWDYGDDDDNREYLGSFERTATPQLYNAHLDGVASRTRVELLEQTTEAGTWTTADGQTLRVITDNSPVWGTVADGDTDQSDPQPDPGSVTAGDTVHAGWFFDLPNTGERAVSDVIIRDGKLLVISFTPGQDPCGSGGSSIFHAMNACSGARPNNSVFANINEVVHEPVSGGETTINKNSGDWKEPTGIEFSGRLQPPVILRKGKLDFHYLSSSTGEVHKQDAEGIKLGIFYWLQME